MKRIVIVGCPGSGKTTLGNLIAQACDIPILYLDALFWVQSGGIKQEPFLEQQRLFMNKYESWISDGNFHRSTSFPLRVQRATNIIIFNLPKHVIMWRFLKRSFATFGTSREDMPDERKETLSTMWHTFRYIWSFHTDEIIERIKDLEAEEKVMMINSVKDEKALKDKIMRGVGVDELL